MGCNSALNPNLPAMQPGAASDYGSDVATPPEIELYVVATRRSTECEARPDLRVERSAPVRCGSEGCGLTIAANVARVK
jgi:hypothetical protein